MIARTESLEACLTDFESKSEEIFSKLIFLLGLDFSLIIFFR